MLYLFSGPDITSDNGYWEAIIKAKDDYHAREQLFCLQEKMGRYKDLVEFSFVKLDNPKYGVIHHTIQS